MTTGEWVRIDGEKKAKLKKELEKDKILDGMLKKNILDYKRENITNNILQKMEEYE